MGGVGCVGGSLYSFGIKTRSIDVISMIPPHHSNPNRSAVGRAKTTVRLHFFESKGKQPDYVARLGQAAGRGGG